MKLFLIPTPIAVDSEGHIPTVIPESARNISHFFVENERTARRFLATLSLEKPIQDLQFFELNKRTEPSAIADCFAQIPPGSRVGILSEAGCPGIADPGARAVAFAHQQGYEVVPLTGPSSILLALMASGFSGQQFAFHGYPPIQPQQRIAYLRKLEADSAKLGQTQIMIETPYRNLHLLDAFKTACKPSTFLCIASELTSSEQFIKTLRIGEWKKPWPNLHKKPTIFLMMA